MLTSAVVAAVTHMTMKSGREMRQAFLKGLYSKSETREASMIPPRQDMGT